MYQDDKQLWLRFASDKTKLQALNKILAYNFLCRIIRNVTVAGVLMHPNNILHTLQTIHVLFRG